MLAIIGRIGTAGGTGHVIEFAGSVIRDLSMEARMTVCNMTIEGGARAGLIAPDDKTFDYIKGRPMAPQGDDWDKAVAYWKTLPSDDGAHFDKEVVLPVDQIEPQVTWGTSPENVLPISGHVPDPADCAEDHHRDSMVRSLELHGPETRHALGRHHHRPRLYRQLHERPHRRPARRGRDSQGTAGRGQRQRHGGAGLRPGETSGRRRRHRTGSDRCGFRLARTRLFHVLAMNADKLEPEERCASTSNRNFEGRQGRGGRTHLVSPAMAAAAAIAGTLTDVRKLVD